MQELLLLYWYAMQSFEVTRMTMDDKSDFYAMSKLEFQKLKREKKVLIQYCSFSLDRPCFLSGWSRFIVFKQWLALSTG